MRSHRSTLTTRPTAAIVALLIAASCGGDSSGVADARQPVDTTVEASASSPSTDATGDDSGTAGDAAAVLEDAVLRLEGVSFFEPELFVLDDPFVDYDASIEMYALTIDSLEAVRSDFPDAADVPIEASEAYTAVLQHLDDWAEQATSALAELEQRRSELEPLTVEWASALESGDPGQPPQEYSALVDVNPSAFEDFTQRCAEFAVSVDLPISCFGTSAPGADGSIEFAVGGITFVIDPGPIDEFIVRPDFFGADLGPFDQMTVSAPFPVRNPAAAVENDATEFLEGAPLDQPVPWPDDIDGYLADSPFEVVGDESVSTPSGEFRRLTVAQDAVAALSFIDLPPGPVAVRLTSPLVLWIGEIQGQPIIATLQAERQSVEAFTFQIDEALKTLRPVD